MSKHLKRLAAPQTVRIHRKERKLTIKPSSGPHPLKQSVPLGLLVRDYLGLCDTYREAKRLIGNGSILVDTVKRKNHKFPCGLMDVVSLPQLKKDYRVLYDRKGKLALVSLSVKEAEWKLCRIENKTLLKGKKVQLNLHDGKNIIVPKDTYHTGDVLKLSLKDHKISEVYPFAKGSISMVIGGSHVGETANIQEIETSRSSAPNLAKLKGDSEFSTLTHYVFPIGKTKPVVALPEVKMT